MVVEELALWWHYSCIIYRLYFMCGRLRGGTVCVIGDVYRLYLTCGRRRDGTVNNIGDIYRLYFTSWQTEIGRTVCVIGAYIVCIARE